MNLASEAAVRRGPLGYAQCLEWWNHQTMKSVNDGWSTNTALVQDVLDGVSKDDVRAALAVLVERHEALRTTFGYDAAGRPVQLVHPPVAPDLIELAVEAGASRRQLVQLVQLHHFRIFDELPVVAAVLTEGGKPLRLMVSFPHVLSDGHSVALVNNELRELLAAAGRRQPATLAPSTRHPLDDAAEDWSLRGRAANDRALRYLAEELRVHPNRNLVGPARMHSSTTALWWISPEAPTVFGAAAERLNVTPAQFYFAAVHVVLHVVSGGQRSSVKGYFSGRLTAAHRRMVGCLARELTTCVDFADRPSLSQVVRRAAAALFAVQRHYRHNYLQYRQTEAMVERRRGAIFVDGFKVNLQYGTGGGPFEWLKLSQPPPPSTATVEGSGPIRDMNGMEAYVSVFWKPTAVEVYGTFNDNLLSVPQMTAILEAPERIAKELSRRGDLRYDEMLALVGVRSEGAAEWVSPTTVHDPAVTVEVLERQPDVDAVHLELHDGRLTAYVLTRQQRMSPHDLRESMLAELQPWIAVVCPDYFVLCSAPPTDPRSPAAWAQAPRFTEGTGVDARYQPRDDREQAVAHAVAWANDLAEVDLASSYVEVGGELALAHRVVERLHDRGYAGLSINDFVRPVCLHRLAGILVPA